MGSYVFRWPYPANDVHVSGTFDDWGKSEQLNKVGDHWEKEVDLPSADEVVYYKFVVDNEWVVDDAAPKQDDGHWNINNVLSPDKIKRKPKPEPKEVTQSTPGAFPEDTESFGVQPIPGTSGVGNPVSVPAGEKLPGQKDITSNTIGSNVTTSKEDYENASSSAFPADSANNSDSFGVKPIPGTTDIGNPISLPAGDKLPDQKEITSNTIGSNVTTSKEDYENAGDSTFPTGSTKEAESYSVNPIPASSGIGNPVSVPAGEKVPASKDVTSNTIDSTVTTSKEAYENPGSSFPGAGIAAGAAAGVTAAGVAAASAFRKPDEKKNIIPESSLPMGTAPVDTMDSGPFISSAAPNTTASQLAANVPLEPKREATVVDSMDPNPFISSAGPGTTTSDLAAKVPLEKKRQAMIVDPLDAPSTEPTSPSVPKTVQDSISDSFQAPEAAASTEAVKEKSDMEKELLSKTERSEATGEPATAAKQQTSYYGLATSVPKPVEDSMQKASAAPEAAADTSAVAEKSAMEKELLSKVHSTDEAGEPAPTIASSTSATAPGTAATAATAITDGKTANSTLPDIDTSTTARGPSAGEIAGGAAVGGVTAAGLTAVSAHHHDEKVAGTASSAAAAVSDGASDEPNLKAPKITSPVEKSEASTTEYAPVRTDGAVPGVSSTAAAALSDGCEDPTLADEPAVRMMHGDAAGQTVHDITTAGPAATGATAASVTTTTGAATSPTGVTGASTGKGSGITLGSATTGSSPNPTNVVAGIPTLTSAATMNTKATEKPAVGASTTTTGTSAPSTPAKKPTNTSATSSPTSSTATKEKKKRHRLSAFIHKIID